MSHHWLSKEDQLARDLLIVKLAKSGLSRRQIAGRMGLSADIVQKAIIRLAKQASQ